MPMWDMNIGYGSDILTTLHYYVIGDPLTLLSVFVPANKTEVLYEVLIFLRIYLAGISFSIFCFYHKNPKQATFHGNIDIYLCRMDDLCCNEASLFFQSYDLSAIDFSWELIRFIRERNRGCLSGRLRYLPCRISISFYMICIFMFIYAAFPLFWYFQSEKEKCEGCIWYGW